MTSIDMYVVNEKSQKKKEKRKDGVEMEVRKAVDEDIHHNLLNLFMEGYQLHYENRKDKFRKRDQKRLKEILIETMKETNVIVIEENKNIVGYLSYQIQEKIKKTLWIDELVIDKKRRHQGLGKLLLTEVEKIAKKKGCSTIEFCYWSFNENAKKVYQHLNYQEQRTIYEKKI